VKRALDFTIAVAGLLLGSVVLVPVMVAVWLQDRNSPLYIADRAAKGGGLFRIVKLRSMRVFADKTGVASTAADDPRVTSVGRFIRKTKLDEATQLWNVLKGDMSLVGPRPQVHPDTLRYTPAEKDLLSVQPGITDLASIVFADEGEILRGAPDPDARYDSIIRPWKSRLALLYVYNSTGISLDLRLIRLTLLNSVNRPAALAEVSRLVELLGGDERLQAVAARRVPLTEELPPGAPGAELHFSPRAV